MKYPYYSPNLRAKDVIQALLVSNKESTFKLEDYYREITGKKYVLLTNSCRTALYLAWKAVGIKGEVITSPLTCRVAIDPIEETGNKPVFADISKKSLNIDVSDIEHRITDKTIAILAIHMGGLSYGMDEIKDLAKQHNLLLVEDCAQSLGATYKGKQSGSFGDVACFSLIKNAYGIGGGVLATNDESIHEKAKDLNSSFKSQSRLLLVYRVIRNIIETRQHTLSGRFLLNMLRTFKGVRKTYVSVTDQLKQISSLEKKIASYQLTRLPELHKKRRSIGAEYSIRLKEKGLLVNTGYLDQDSSFTKYYLFNPSFDFLRIKDSFLSDGVEIKHLEQNMNSSVQGRMISRKESERLKLTNFDQVHDSLISLPITEKMTSEDVEKVINSLEKNIQK